MKRHPSLQPLSDDHHGALVLARRLCRAASETDRSSLAELSEEVRQLLEADLEPHFRVEEMWLLPALTAKGGSRLADRVAADHARLRELIGGPWSKGAPKQIGTLLEKHVRFEERELFPMAEMLLSAVELSAVRDATRQSRECGRHPPSLPEERKKL